MIELVGRCFKCDDDQGYSLKLQTNVDSHGNFSLYCKKCETHFVISFKNKSVEQAKGLRSATSAGSRNK